LVPGVDMDRDGRKLRTYDNNWLQDRAAMKNGTSMSGIRGVQMEDAVIQESMGPVYDRWKEHLGSSDIAVARMRRLMLQSVRGLMDEGKPPLGLAELVSLTNLRGEEAVIPLGTRWQSVCRLGEAQCADPPRPKSGVRVPSGPS
ncbi:MAG: hypothetical protein ACREFQ_19065, partial [Stellaceae bacterium]